MISPQIEAALISGKATLHTHAHMYSAVSKVIVPDGRFAIVTDIYCHPFTDAEAPTAAVNDLEGKSTHLLDLLSESPGGTRRQFIYRNSPNVNKDQLDRAFWINSPPVHFDTFIVFTENFFLAVMNLPGLIEAAGRSFGALSNTQLPDSPVSYGRSKSVLRWLQDATGFQYIPTSIEESAATSQANQSTQPRTLPMAPALLSDLTGWVNPSNNQLPLIQLQYVVINEQYRKDFTK